MKQDPALSLLKRESAFRALLLLFFLSGATSLVYETLWGRALHLIFGTGPVAIATVLAAFMGGLGLGALWMARRADGLTHPLRIYGLLEAGIGVYALVFPALLAAFAPLYLGLWRLLEPGPAVFAALQAALVGLLLLPPTTAMGATLPLLARFATTRLQDAGSRVGFLYAANTTGAVVGTWLVGFFALPAWGMATTTGVAAATNIGLAVAALLLSWRVGEGAPLEVEGEARPRSDDRLLLLVAALAGFSALACELAWFRLMTLTLGGSAYAFSLMLLAFLLGLALGGRGGGVWADRLWAAGGRHRVLLGLAAAQAAVALSTWAMMWGYGQLPYLFVELYDIVEQREAWFWPGQLWLAGAVMTPPALFMGASFPLLVRACVEGPSRLGSPVGRLYGANTLGGVLGSLMAAFVLLPRLNLVGTLQLAAAVNLAAGLLVLLSARGGLVRQARLPAQAPPPAPASLRLPALLLATLGVFVVAVQPPWDRLFMTSGMYKYVTGLKHRSREAVHHFAVEGYDLLFYEEGLSSVVTVGRTPRNDNLWLTNNGKVDASLSRDMSTQVLLGHLPFMLGRDLKDACVIGLASGVTAGSVVLHSALRHIDVVEIEPAVVTASHFFDEHNNRPLADPRTRLVLNDGRNHLLLTPPGSYDLVVSEPPNPWLTGVANLFTLDFFQMGRARLRPGGVWCQWVQLYGMGTNELWTILRTFARVYPHVAVFASIADADLVLLGSDTPLTLHMDDVRATWEQDPALVADLARVDVKGPHDLLTRYQLDRDSLLRMAGEGPLNTDDNMAVEYAAARLLHHETSVTNYMVLRGEDRTAVGAVHLRGDFLDLARAYGAQEEWVKALIVLKEGLVHYPGDEEIMALGREYQVQLYVSLQ